MPMLRRTARPGRKSSLATAIAVARMRREQAKYPSVQAFVQKLGISEGTYNLLVNGGTNPTVDTLEKIAAGLGLTFFELIGNIDVETLRKRLALVRLDLDAITKTVEAYDAAMAGFDSMIADEAPSPKRKRQRAAIGAR